MRRRSLLVEPLYALFETDERQTEIVIRRAFGIDALFNFNCEEFRRDWDPKETEAARETTPKYFEVRCPSSVAGSQRSKCYTAGVVQQQRHDNVA